jgi:hypothetical protein
MNRLILRLAAVSALNNFMTEPYPTLAGPHIFDSKIEPVENSEEDKSFPLCVVYSDYDKNSWKMFSSNMDKRTITITFEILVATIEDEGEYFNISSPQTDSELESALDIFESQIYEAFNADNSAANCMKFLINGVESTISRRGATVESGQRLAARQVTIECDVHRDFSSGAIPEPIEAFLQDLENSADYGDRVQEFRDLYAAGSSGTDMEQAMRVGGFSKELGAILGLQRGVQAVMTTPIQWIDTNTGGSL